ncbi:putative alpha/beta hydrolase [Streptomyces mayteni]
MAAITITNQEVVAAAGKDPWKLRQEFSADTQLDAIEVLATTFRDGAAEAEGTADTARNADQTERDAGDHAGRAIYANAERHLAETQEKLGAADLDGISRVLRQVHGEAEDTLEAHTEAIEGVCGLDVAVDREEDQANRDFESVIEQLNAIPPMDRLGSTIKVYDKAFPLTAGVEEDIRAYVEDFHTREAGRQATRTFQSMDEARDDYYGLLSRKQQDLTDLGYDVGDSPVNIWRTAAGGPAAGRSGGVQAVGGRRSSGSSNTNPRNPDPSRRGDASRAASSPATTSAYRGSVQPVDSPSSSGPSSGRSAA